MILGIALASVGMCLIAASMQRHRAVLAPWLSSRAARPARWIGFVLSLLAAAPVMTRLGIAIGLVAWLMVLSVGVVFAATLCAVISDRTRRSW